MSMRSTPLTDHRDGAYPDTRAGAASRTVPRDGDPDAALDRLFALGRDAVAAAGRAS
jgi:hypothetical protein